MFFHIFSLFSTAPGYECHELQIFPNLGFATAETTILTFESFEKITTNIEFKFPTLKYLQENFTKKIADCKFAHKTENWRSFFNDSYNADFQAKMVEKLKSFDLNVDNRSRRQAGVLAGIGLSYFVHKIFGTNHNVEIRNLEKNLNLTHELRNTQIKNIDNQLINVKCKLNELIVQNFEKIRNDILSKELNELDTLLTSLKYRTGMNAKIYKLFKSACSATVGDEKLCASILIERKFALQFEKIFFGPNSLKFEISFGFPAKVQEKTALDLINFGVFRKVNESFLGRKISDLENHDTFLSPIAFNIKNKCTFLGHYYLCNLYMLNSISVPENKCLESIFANLTSGCNFEPFAVHRPCLVHKLDNTVLINAAIPYMLSIIQKNALGKKIAQTMTGVPGLNPIIFENSEIREVTLTCGNKLEIIELGPITLENHFKIFDKPSAIREPHLLSNNSELSRLNKIIANLPVIIDPKTVKDNLGPLMTVIITFLGLCGAFFIIYCIHSKMSRRESSANHIN